MESIAEELSSVISKFLYSSFEPSVAVSDDGVCKEEKRNEVLQ